MTTTTRSFRRQDRLSDAEVHQHVCVAVAALNSTLAEASRHSAEYAYDSNPRYTLALSSDPTLAARGLGTLYDAKTNITHNVRVCFGRANGQIELQREFFEDVSDTEVRVKASSRANLFRHFLECLREINREAGRWSFGPASATTAVAMTA